MSAVAAGVATLPLTLPQLSRADAVRLNRRHRWRAPLPLPGNERFSLQLLEANAPPPSPEERLRLRFSVGGDRLEADLPRPLMLDLMRSLDSGLLLDPLPSPDLAALLLEGALLPLVDAMNSGTGRPVILDALAEPDGISPGDRRTILLTGAGLHQLLAVAGTPDGLDRLLEGWRSGRRPLDGLPLPVRLCYGSTVLTRRLLRSLRVGDVVLAQRCDAVLHSDGTASAAALHVADSLGAVVRRAGTGWRLEMPLRALDRTNGVSENGSSPGSDHPGPNGPRTPDIPAAASQGLGEAELDALPVQLRFEAGRLELSLGALRQLGAGSVLEFEGEPGQVAILCSGRRIGSGTLVSVEGHPGIRIDGFADGLDGGQGA